MNTDKKQQTMSLRMTEKIFPRLQKVAERNSLSASDVTRMCIEIGLEYFEGLGDRRVIDAIVGDRPRRAATPQASEIGAAPSAATNQVAVGRKSSSVLKRFKRAIGPPGYHAPGILRAAQSALQKVAVDNRPLPA